MQLRSIHVYSNYNESAYKVKADFEGIHGEISLELGAELGNQVLALCLDKIVEAVGDIAAKTKENILETHKAGSLLLENDK